MKKVMTMLVCLVLLLLGLFYWIPTLKNAFETLPGTTVKNHSSNAETFSTWKEFVPSSGLFKVLFPHSPQYAKDLVEVPNSDKKRRYDMYASEKIDGTLFLINVITYPAEVNTSSSSEILRQTIDDLMHGKSDNRLTKVKESSYQSHPAMDFIIDNKEFHVEGKDILVDKTIYVLSYITSKNDFDPIEYKYFIDSFELLNKEKQESKS